jgi:hypothetical protein
LLPILNQMNPATPSLPTFLKSIHIPPPTPMFSMWSLPFWFPNQTLYAFLTSRLCITCPAHISLFNLITLITFGEAYKLLSSSLFSFLHPSTTHSLLVPNILLSTLFLNTLNLASSLHVRDQVSHPYKTKAKIIVVYILSLSFFSDEMRRQ